MNINQYWETEFHQPSQAEEMPTPVKAFTKITEIVNFFCLNKERYLLVSTSLVHSFSFMMFYDILCDYVDVDVLPVPLTAFDVFFLPTFGSFSLQTCLFSWRLICPAIVPETRPAKRNV